jgi:putative SOS response-associated peptidase YedK
MESIHDRMPVILQPEQYDFWLDPENHDNEALQDLIRPAEPALMSAYPVSPAINSGRVEGTECIEALSK